MADSKDQAAIELIQELLDEDDRGEMDAVVIKDAARMAGISERSLLRAKKRLHIRSERRGGAAEHGYWIWRRGPDTPTLSSAWR